MLCEWFNDWFPFGPVDFLWGSWPHQQHLYVVFGAESWFA